MLPPPKKEKEGERDSRKRRLWSGLIGFFLQIGGGGGWLVDDIPVSVHTATRGRCLENVCFETRGKNRNSLYVHGMSEQVGGIRWS